MGSSTRRRQRAGSHLPGVLHAPGAARLTDELGDTAEDYLTNNGVVRFVSRSGRQTRSSFLGQQVDAGSRNTSAASRV